MDHVELGPDEFSSREYERFARQLANGECILFLGAGASYGRKGEGIPTATELRRILSGELTENEYEPKGDWGLSTVAQYYEIMLGRSELIRKLRKVIEASELPQELHQQIARLPFRIIFTTNYDRLLESEFERTERVNSIVVISNEREIEKWDDQKTIIVKLHGSVEKAEDLENRLIITDDDYVKFMADPLLLKDSFKHIVATKTVFFIGYSLSDYNVRVLLEEMKELILKKEERGLPAIYLMQRERFSELEMNYWKNKGVHLKKCDGVEFLSSLKAHFDRIAPEEIIGDKFDFYLSHCRLEAIDVFHQKVVNAFVDDIRAGRTLEPGYRFGGQLKDAFNKVKDQERLALLLDDGDKSTLEAIVDLLVEIGGKRLSSRLRKKVLAISKEDHNLLEFLLREYYYNLEELSDAETEYISGLSEMEGISDDIREKAKAVLERHEVSNYKRS